MSIHVKMAWRNIWRNPRRTTVIMIAVIIGLWSMIFMGAFHRGMINQMVENGIATLTGRYAERVAGTGCVVLDTRKTLPGYRHLAKYAVRCGGGQNHRLGLYDRIMLKDNHWAAAGGSIEELVQRSRERHPGLAVEIEVAQPLRGFDLPSDSPSNSFDRNRRGLLCEWAVATGLSLKGWNQVESHESQTRKRVVRQS